MIKFNLRTTIWVLASIFVIANAGNVDLNSSINSFANSLFQYVDQNTKNNIVVSPVALQSAMALADAGSRGRTTKGIDQSIQLGDYTVSQVIHSFHKYLKALKSASDQNTNLSIATKIFIDKSDTVSKYFKNAACRFYASVGTIDFSNIKSAVKAINKWVSKKTNKQITNIVTPSNIPAGTNMMIINAIYFKGAWAKPFSEDKTAKGPFNSTPSKSKSIYMMHQTNTFPYGTSSALNAQIVQFPYTQPGLSMVVVLPNSITGLPATLKALQNMNLGSLTSSLTPTQLAVTLPKFSFGFQMGYAHYFKNQGARIAFTPDADFGNMISNPGHLQIGDIIQKAHVKITEKGASSGSKIATTLTPPNSSTANSQSPVTFDVDQPFFFTILDNGNPVFEGTYTH